MSTKRAIYLRHSLIGIILLLCLIPACYGQGEHHFTFNAGAGVSPLVGGHPQSPLEWMARYSWRWVSIYALLRNESSIHL